MLALLATPARARASAPRGGWRPVSKARSASPPPPTLVNDLLEARDDKRLGCRLQKQLAKQRSVDRRRARLRPVVEDHRRAAVRDLLPALRHASASTLVTSNLAPSRMGIRGTRSRHALGSERLHPAPADSDRLTAITSTILDVLNPANQTYRLEHSKKARPHAASPAP